MPFGAILGPSWDALGAIWGHLGMPWGPFGAILKPPWMRRGKAAKQMMRQDVLRLFGIRECCYFTSFEGCFEEVPHQRIEVVHVLVDVAYYAFLDTCGFTLVLIV